MRHAIIDFAAIRDNMRTLRGLDPQASAMAVVKADGYGHGAADVARAALEAGAEWIGVCDAEEAVELRAAGITAPVLCWLHSPYTDFRDAVRRDIDIGVSSIRQLEMVVSAAQQVGVRANIQVKLDTGLSRNGAMPEIWPELFEAARKWEKLGVIRARGIFSHLSNTNLHEDAKALERFRAAVKTAHASGLRVPLHHLAASAAGLRIPQTRLSMVRWGLALYGLSPFADTSSVALGLRPAMSLCSVVAHLRDVPRKTGVSYDHTYRTTGDTTLALVPLGYADGIPRAASNAARVQIGERLWPVRGRIAMDQFVVEVDPRLVNVGDRVTVFGDPMRNEPSADEWANASDTINYEIVSGLGPRVKRIARN